MEKAKPKTKATMWRVTMKKELVEQLDEHRWEMRVARRVMVERVVRLALHLLETPAGEKVSMFEMLEAEYSSEAA